MRAFADKLINILEKHRNDIAAEWCKGVRSNPRTPSFHKLDPAKCSANAIMFYQNLDRIYFDKKPYKAVIEYFTYYAEDNYRKKIPLHEAIYALIMMRRQMWLYAEFQAPFFTGLEHHQAVETINKTIRVFDHGIYIMTERYLELMEAERKK